MSTAGVRREGDAARPQLPICPPHIDKQKGARSEVMRAHKKKLFLVAFIREGNNGTYRVLVLRGPRGRSSSLIAEVEQEGPFSPVHHLSRCAQTRTIQVRTPPVYLMRGWVA